MCQPAAWAMPVPQASLQVLGMDPSQCSVGPYRDAGDQCRGTRDPTLAPHHGKSLGTECVDWWGHRGCARSCTAPAWDSELDPTAPGRIVALTRHLCALSTDDCKNIANIMKTLAHRGFIFKQTSKPF